MRDTRGMAAKERITEPDEAQDFEFAPIEELDPEPATDAAHIGRREVVVGLLLVCALVAFGAWQWWDQGGKWGHSRAGEQPAAPHDWAAAHDAYLAAGDYADAARRAAEA